MLELGIAARIAGPAAELPLKWNIEVEWCFRQFRDLKYAIPHLKEHQFVLATKKIILAVAACFALIPCLILDGVKYFIYKLVQKKENAGLKEKRKVDEIPAKAIPAKKIQVKKLDEKQNNFEELLSAQIAKAISEGKDPFDEDFIPDEVPLLK